VGDERGCDGVKLDLPADSPLRSLAESKPTLVVLLRSFNCTFCREALADVAAAKPAIDAAGAHVAFVHVESAAEAEPWFDKYGLRGVVHISDPSRAHYLAFGLDRTNPASLISPTVWTRGASCALEHGFGVQNYEMMRRQPGVFLVRGNRIVAEHRHSTPADRPDYAGLVCSGKTLVQ
jgi:hypothetical protein